MLVQRPRTLTLGERVYLPGILKGMWLTLKHMFRPKVTLRYPEEKWQVPEYYRGLPVLVADQDGRTKCVACFLCQWVCPPRAITIQAQELASNNVEKGPREFEINMLRCIMCGYCEEVCPEEAIFMSKHYELTGKSRQELIFNKDQLLKLGGARFDPIKKWDHK
ncbi:MAG: NADH-quinone oxidoreductase subunit I [Acidobacteria bacterium]|nr:NADH-quinone oxidoreductase subunit I [Acidobacteriota bacterium]